MERSLTSASEQCPDRHQRQEALARLEAGETQDVARTYNVDATTIGRLLSDHGKTLRDHSGRRNEKRPDSISQSVPWGKRSCRPQRCYDIIQRRRQG
jgi:hypothetical protein